jgi:hypothetical protein
MPQKPAPRPSDTRRRSAPIARYYPQAHGDPRKTKPLAAPSAPLSRAPRAHQPQSPSNRCKFRPSCEKCGLAQLSRYPGSAIFLGLRADAVVTTCTLIIVPNLTRGGAPYALIENVVTDARHQKRGYGKLVLKAAVAAAWRHGCYKVMLLTGSRDPATLRFYEDVGFEQSKTGFQVRRVPAREP